MRDSLRKQGRGRWRCGSGRGVRAVTIVQLLSSVYKRSKYYLVDRAFRRPCYVTVIIVCLCKPVCDNMLRLSTNYRKRTQQAQTGLHTGGHIVCCPHPCKHTAYRKCVAFVDSVFQAKFIVSILLRISGICFSAANATLIPHIQSTQLCSCSQMLNVRSIRS